MQVLPSSVNNSSNEVYSIITTQFQRPLIKHHVLLRPDEACLAGLTALSFSIKLIWSCRRRECDPSHLHCMAALETVGVVFVAFPFVRETSGESPVSVQLMWTL